MKKIMKVCLCGLAATALISGCSKKATDKTTEAPTTTAEAVATISDATETVAEETLESVDLEGIDNGTITLGEYKGIEVTKDPVEVTDEEVTEAIQNDLAANPTYIDVDRAIQEDDRVNIDYVGKKDGVAFDGGTAQGQNLTIGSNQYIDGFEDGLIGHKKGDKVTLNLTFPDNYPQEDLAGQKVVFDVTVNNVTVKKDSELNDEFVKSNTNFQTVNEYKEDKKQSMVDSKTEQADQKVSQDIYNAIYDASKVTASQEAIDANYNNLLVQYNNQAKSYGVDLKTLATAMFGMSEDDFKEQLKKQALSVVEQRLVINAIADKEGIKVTDEDREETAKKYNFESADKMNETVGKYVADDYILNTKVMDFLTENAVIK